MKILFLTIANEEISSSRSRVYQYLPFLEREGINSVVITYEWTWYTRKILAANSSVKIFLRMLAIVSAVKKSYSVLKVLFICPNYDVVFVQKAFPPLFFSKLLSARAKNVVLDYDDAVYVSDTDYRHDSFHFLLSQSKLAVIENDATESVARRAGINTLRITGPIDCHRYKPVRVDGNPSKCESVTIGWIGGSTTSKYLSEVAIPLRKLCSEHRHLRVLLIGALDVQLSGVPTERQPWSLDTEIKYLSEIDIGIMPLPTDEWTIGKGGYKLLQYMAMGKPSVASPVGVNMEIIEHGRNGYLASNAEEWFTYLRVLILDRSLRMKMGLEGRLIAEEKYSFEVAAPRLIDSLRQIVEGGKNV